MATKFTSGREPVKGTILKLDFTVCSSDCKSLNFTETTGVYSETTNTTGWGTPNPDISEATSAELTILTPSNNTYTFDLYATGNYPTSLESNEFSISYGDLGFTTTLEDGEYTFTYTVIITTYISEDPVYTTYTKTKKFYVTCNIECCINKLLLNLEDVNCDCNKEARSKYLEAFALLQAYKHANACGRLGTATELFNELTKICSNVDCKTCQ